MLHWLFKELLGDTLYWRNSQLSPPWRKQRNALAENSKRPRREFQTQTSTKGWFIIVKFIYNNHRQQTGQCLSEACLWERGGTWRTRSHRYRGARAAGAKFKSVVIHMRIIIYIKVADTRLLWLLVLATDTNNYHRVHAGSPAPRKADLVCIITIHR